MALGGRPQGVGGVGEETGRDAWVDEKKPIGWKLEIQRNQHYFGNQSNALPLQDMEYVKATKLANGDLLLVDHWNKTAKVNGRLVNYAQAVERQKIEIALRELPSPEDALALALRCPPCPQNPKAMPA